MDEHELVAAVKKLAFELGRTPTRREFEGEVKGANYKLAKFGGYVPLLQAAGLDANNERDKRKITSAVFNKSIETHLDEYKPLEPKQRNAYPKIAVISDIHWPFSSQRVISRFLDFIEVHQPDWVIINGDAWDMYSSAKFPRSHNVFTPKDERDMSREENEKFWVEVHKRCPKAEKRQLLGNHDVRPLKRILEVFPSGEHWIAQALKDDFTFPGVTTLYDSREELMIGDIMVHHGYRTKMGDHRDHALFNAIVGHSHVGGVSYRQIRGQVLWEVNSGVAGDCQAKGLTYTPQRITNWTPGFAYVDQYGPRFIAV